MKSALERRETCSHDMSIWQHAINKFTRERIFGISHLLIQCFVTGHVETCSNLTEFTFDSHKF